MKRIGIVIPFFGGNQFLSTLLRSLHTERADIELLVFLIDNSRPGETASEDVLKSFNVELIRTEAALGYGKACNIGFARCVQALCDVIMVVNQDGYFAPGALDRLITDLITAEEATVTMPLLTLYETDEVEWFFTHVYLTPLTKLVSDLFRGKTDSKYLTNKLCGACFALKLPHYTPFSYLFDELFHMYCEDEDLGERLKKMNRQIYLVPGAVFHHTHGNTSNWDTEPLRAKMVRRESRLIFNLKQNQRSIIRQLPGWLLLELRVMIEYLLTFRWQMLVAELSVVVKIFGKLSAINRQRNLEQNLLKQVR